MAAEAGAPWRAIQLVSAAQASARAIVERLRSRGYDAYFAGGCVRDMLLGLTPQDFDVATSALPDVVLDLFERTFSVGAHFGVVLVADQVDGHEIVTEVATFRSDGAYSDGRRPDTVRFSQSAEEDVARRDFTINGMLLDPLLLDVALLASPNESGVPHVSRLRDRSYSRETKAPADLATIESAVLDYVGGRADLAGGLIRAIGNPAIRFEEDKLRMLRAVRFAARFAFETEPFTAAAIRDQAAGIAQVSSERVRDELTRMLTEGRARQAFELLDATGLLIEVLPEVSRMKGVEQPPEFHPEGDVWTHTLMLLEKLEPGCPATLGWGALLHDVGKPPTFRRAPERIRFDGHVEVGVRMAEAICKRLRFSNEDTAQILSLIQNHMRFGDVQRMKESTLKRFFRLPSFEQHLALHRMDVLSSFGDLTLYNFAKQRYETLPPEHVRPQLLVTGEDLISAGYRPGPEFKAMLAAAEDAQLEGRIHSREEGLALIVELFPVSLRP